MQKLLWLFLSLTVSVSVEGQDVCTPCWDGADPDLTGSTLPGEERYVCQEGVDMANTTTSGSPECLSIQLATWQGSCCDELPENYCTICPDGSQNFNAEKLIPRNARSPTADVTCANVEGRNQYLRDVEGVYGNCEVTPRARSGAWCECDGVQPACNLLCDDGQPPPDLSKFEPIFEETCERFMYEYTTLTADQCPNAVTLLGFDAKAFCCNEEPPENCSICSDGQTLIDPEKLVRNDLSTCGEIETHASYLPDKCLDFISELLDNPFDAASECCEGGPDSDGVVSGAAIVGSVFISAFTAVFLVVNVYVF